MLITTSSMGNRCSITYLSRSFLCLASLCKRSTSSACRWAFFASDFFAFFFWPLVAVGRGKDVCRSDLKGDWMFGDDCSVRVTTMLMARTRCLDVWLTFLFGCYYVPHLVILTRLRTDLLIFVLRWFRQAGCSPYDLIIRWWSLSLSLSGHET